MGITGSTLNDNKFFGFRLYKIFEGGPLGESGLTELDNFIIPPEDVLYNKISFYEYIKNNLNKNVTLQIYSVIKRIFYTIDVTPRNDWGDQKNGFLGACVRYENWSTAHTNILRVIKVKENSISEKVLKLKPLDDYIISIRPENKDFITLNKDTSDPMTIFQEVLQDNIANFIEVFIYNINNGPRSVKLFLERKNGEILGCDVAYGKLHELPKIYNEEIDKNLVFKESEVTNINKNENSNESKTGDFVLEETKKILMGNINRNKISNNNIKNDESNEKNEFETKNQINEEVNKIENSNENSKEYNEINKEKNNKIEILENDINKKEDNIENKVEYNEKNSNPNKDINQDKFKEDNQIINDDIEISNSY